MRWLLKTTPIAAGIVLLCILCVVPGRSAQAASRDSDIAPVLLSLERSKFRALEQADTAVLNAIFDDALMLVDSNGGLSAKAGYLEALHNSGGSHLLRVVPESMTVRVFGSMAIVVGIYDETEMKAGHATHRRCRFIDTWQFKNGRWVCIAATATSTIA